ncbi:hypothetical protein Tco_1388963, partial [Tanacetum coccineum]
AMAEVDINTLTMEQYLTLSRDNQAPGVGPIPGMTPALALTAIQTMADHSQKWHDGTSSRSIGSNSSNDGLAALVEEVKYGEFGRPTPFNGSNGEKFRVGPPGYYTKTDNRPPYGERRPSLEELLNKHQEESARRSSEIEVWIKKLQENAEINTRNQSASVKNLETQIEQLTKELHSTKTCSLPPGQIKTVNTHEEAPMLNNLHGESFITDTENDTSEVLQCASINVMPRSIFEYLRLKNLKPTNMLCEMADMTKKDDSTIINNLTIRSFDDYKWEFDLEIDKLADEYELGIGKKDIFSITFGNIATKFIITVMVGTTMGLRKKSVMKWV